MPRSFLLLAVLCTGCLVVPATKTTTRPAGTERSAVRHGRILDVQLEAAASRAEVEVKATSKRECLRDIFSITEVTTSKTARLGGAEDPRARAFGFFLAPVTIPISALITGLVVAVDRDETTRQSRPARTETFACTIPAAQLALELAFPSGTVQHGKTDAMGRLAMPIPDGEPYSGEVVVRAGSATTHIRYEQGRPPVTVARDAIETCREQHQVGEVTMKLKIDAAGRAVRLWLSAGDAAFNTCVATKIASLAFPEPLRGKTVVFPFGGPAG